MAEFVEWRKIFRFYRDFEITEKIDGTNGVLYWTPAMGEPGGLAEVDGLALYAGSRNRWLSLDADNHQFAEWATDNATALRPLGPGYHFGEWMGYGIQRGYGLSEKFFLLFDFDRFAKLQAEAGYRIPVGCVPHIADVPGDQLNERITEILDDLRAKGSWHNGFERPEGIVLKHKQSGVRFKVLLEGDETPKSMRGMEVSHG